MLGHYFVLSTNGVVGAVNADAILVVARGPFTPSPFSRDVINASGLAQLKKHHSLENTHKHNKMDLRGAPFSVISCVGVSMTQAYCHRPYHFGPMEPKMCTNECNEMSYTRLGHSCVGCSERKHDFAATKPGRTHPTSLHYLFNGNECDSDDDDEHARAPMLDGCDHPSHWCAYHFYFFQYFRAVPLTDADYTW